MKRYVMRMVVQGLMIERFNRLGDYDFRIDFAAGVSRLFMNL